MTSPLDVLIDTLEREQLLPLAVAHSISHAHQLVDSIVAEGRSVVEVALRSTAALGAIAAVSPRSDVLVGAGTVRRRDEVDAVVDAGARFVVTPGFSEPVVQRCRERGVPVLPGVSTPGEIMRAVALGLDTVKLFPAAVLGGTRMVDALAGPFPDVRLVPSGGVDETTAPDYLERPTVIAVSRSWHRPQGPAT